MGTGIKLIITIIAETHLIPCQITWQRVIMAMEQSNRREVGLLRLHVRLTTRQIDRKWGFCINTSINHAVKSGRQRGFCVNTTINASSTSSTAIGINTTINIKLFFWSSRSSSMSAGGGRSMGGSVHEEVEVEARRR